MVHALFVLGIYGYRHKLLEYEIIIAFPLQQWLRERAWILATHSALPVFSIRAQEHIRSQLYVYFIFISSQKSGTETETGTRDSCTVPKNFNMYTKPYLLELMFQIWCQFLNISGHFWKILDSITTVSFILKLVWNLLFASPCIIIRSTESTNRM